MVSSDRIAVYIGTYTRRESFVDGKAEGIYIYHLDPNSGELTYAATVDRRRHGQPFVSDPGAGQKLSVRCQRALRKRSPERDYERLCHRSGNRASELSEPAIHPWHAPCYASIEPQGRYCLVANYETGNVCVLPVRKDGQPG